MLWEGHLVVVGLADGAGRDMGRMSIGGLAERVDMQILSDWRILNLDICSEL